MKVFYWLLKGALALLVGGMGDLEKMGKFGFFFLFFILLGRVDAQIPG